MEDALAFSAVARRAGRRAAPPPSRRLRGHPPRRGLAAVTPIFMHFGIVHLLFDLWALALFGSLIEYRRGTRTLAVLVLAVGDRLERRRVPLRDQLARPHR